jgi:phosphohistidine phosphatase
MRLLTLIRHAKSSWDSPGLSDFERPLNERGRRDAPLMATRVNATLPQPQRLVTSPALRAATTARCFAEQLGVPLRDIRFESAIYDAGVPDLMRVVQSLDDSDLHVFMFGHNPGFSDLARRLAPCPFSEMPTCAVVSLELDAALWNTVRAGCGRVREYLYPKDGA